MPDAPRGRKSDDGPSGIGGRPADPYVTERLTGPADVPARSLRLSGLLGDSDRSGYRRLYFNKQLDYYAEFASADVLSVAAVPPDEPPFVGLDATRVELRRDATVTFTQVRSAPPLDEFDLDLHLGAAGLSRSARAPVPAETWEAECPGDTRFGCDGTFACGTDNDCPTGWTVCKPATCRISNLTPCPTDFGATCDTCATCQTCQTCPGQGTCQTCGQGTCQTCGQGTCQTCNQATCQTCGGTCQTCAGQATCRTCETCAGHGTCRTCDTCNPHVFTCGNNPQC